MFVFHCCCFLLLFAICGCASPAASLNPVIYAQVGQPLTLNCSLRDSLRDSLRVWYKDNIPIPTISSSRTEFLQNGSLFFRNLQLTQSGWYTCATSNSTGMEELLIVGASPRLDITYTASSPYTVLPNSRVELPCVVSGTPTPTVEWRNGSDGLIMNDTSFRIDCDTHSLVIGSYTTQPPLTHQGPYYCVARNQLDVSQSDRINVNVTSTAIPMMYNSPLNSVGTEVHLASNSYLLQCTGLSQTDLDSANYTLRWKKNFMDISPMAMTSDSFEVAASPANSGYYCCSVSYNMEVISRHCVTVWIRETPTFMFRPLRTITLPSGMGRSAQLLCITNPLTYNPPEVNWQMNGVHVVNETGLTMYGSAPVGFNFLRVANVSINGNESTTNYTCVATNLEGTETVTVSVSAVELCRGSNMIISGDAEGNASWTFSNANASVVAINNENVFVLSYAGSGTTLRQTLSLNGATSFHISGRIRQTSIVGAHRGIAALRVIFSDNVKTLNFENPAPSTNAWQWVGQTVPVPSILAGATLTVELVVLPSPGMSESTLTGVAYFDDICVSQEAPQLQLELIIGAAVGGAVILILLLLILLVCCCCCCSRKKGDTRRMTKMSINMGKKLTGRWKKRHGDVVSELKTTKSNSNVGVESKSYRRTSNDGGRPMSPRNVPLIPPASPPVYNPPVHVENTDGEYADPREYDYVGEQTPQFEIGRPFENSNGDDIEGVYTALKPQCLNQENLYTTATPVSHRSMTSLHDAIEDEDEYVNVEPAPEDEYVNVEPVPSYLQLISSSCPSKSSVILPPPFTNGSLPEGVTELSPTSVDHGEQLYAIPLQEVLYVNDPRTSPAKLDPVSGEVYSYVNDV